MCKTGGMNVEEMAVPTLRTCRLGVWPRFNKQELWGSDYTVAVWTIDEAGLKKEG